MDTAKVGV